MRYFISLLFFTICFGQVNTSISGNIDMFSMFKTSNSSLIKLPYRLVNIQVHRQNGNLDVIGKFAMEHQLNSDTYFLANSSPQDFSLDLRELYFTWFTNYGEIKLGKQIYSWGMVDENSPLDNINAYDYYYLFFGGTDRKIGSYSLGIDLYFENWKFSAIFSPVHNTNRLPLNDPNFPIQFSTVPQDYQILEISGNPIEYGGSVQRSFTNGELRLSLFKGYDRLFNFSGINVFVYLPGDPSLSYIDIVYGYRKTQQINIGGVILLGDLIFRTDYSEFDTKDQNTSIERENPNPISNFENLEFSYPLNEEAKYKQFTFQLEYGLPWDITAISQYIKYDIISYKSSGLPIDEDIDITNLEIDSENLDPRNIFTPGMGTPLAILSKKVLLLNLEKNILDNRLKLNILSLLDINNSNFNFPSTLTGTLLELGLEYSLMDGFNLLGAVTKITGDSKHENGDNYTFNQMEEFSHYRLEIKYFF